MIPKSEILRNAPLLQVLLDYANQERVSFHMPGHQGGNLLPRFISERLAEIDATELPVTADLNDPEGAALSAMQLAAEAFQAGETLFVTGGSTTAIQAMITAFCPRGSTIAMPRAVHRSILNTAILLELKIIFLPAVDTFWPLSIAPIQPPEAVGLRKVLQQYQDIRAVLVTSPDYFGTCPDLAALAAVSAEFGCPLLVDEAHGAHLSFAPEILPPAAMAAGASACVQSAHKTLPALTQGAYLHRNAKAVLAGTAGGLVWPDDGRLRQSLSLYQTSSPSLMIGATLDYARSLLQAEGRQSIKQALTGIERFHSALSPVYRCSGTSRHLESDFVWRDPLRLVVDVMATGLTGFEVADQLTAQGIDVEMADIRRLVLIPGIFRSEHDHLLRLAAKLNDIADKAASTTNSDEIERKAAENSLLDRKFYRSLQIAPAAFTYPALPFLQDQSSRLVELVATEGRAAQKYQSTAEDQIAAKNQVAAEALIPYPPGIPLVWPGEKLGNRLALLRLLIENGFGVHGVVKQGGNYCIRVVDS